MADDDGIDWNLIDGIDWNLVDDRLAVAEGPEGIKHRDKLFQRLDPNGNAQLSLTEVQAGLTSLLEAESSSNRKTDEVAQGLIPGITDFRPASKVAFKLARNSGKSSGGDSATVDRSEFHALLVYFRHYLELLVVFKNMDSSGDMTLSNKEILPSIGRLAKWNLTKEQVKSKLKASGGEISFGNFSEWVVRGKLEGCKFDENEGKAASLPSTPAKSARRQSGPPGKSDGVGEIDWAEVDARIPTDAEPESRLARDGLFKQMDLAGKGELSMIDVQASIAFILEDHSERKRGEAARCILPGIRDTRPAAKAAFSAARELASQTGSPTGSKKTKRKEAADDTVDRREFHALLVYLRYYLELQIVFQQIDTSEDLRVSKDECMKALPLLTEWGIDVIAIMKKFKAAKGELKFGHFADWCLRTKLQDQMFDILEDDAPEDESEASKGHAGEEPVDEPEKSRGFASNEPSDEPDEIKGHAGNEPAVETEEIKAHAGNEPAGEPEDIKGHAGKDPVEESEGSDTHSSVEASTQQALQTLLTFSTAEGFRPLATCYETEGHASNEPADEPKESKGHAGNEPEDELEEIKENVGKRLLQFTLFPEDEPEEIKGRVGNKAEDEPEESPGHASNKTEDEPEEISMDIDVTSQAGLEDFGSKIARNTFPEEVVSRPSTRDETPQAARSNTPQAARSETPNLADSLRHTRSTHFATTEDDLRNFEGTRTPSPEHAEGAYQRNFGGARTPSPQRAGRTLKRGLTAVFSRSLPSLPMESQGVLKRPPHLKNLSHVRSLPKWRFGEKRPSAFFLYNSNPAPGSYNLPDPGRTGKFREKPVCSFGGGGPRFGYAPNPHHVQPAPGQYGIVKNPVQPSTGNDRKVGFSMAPRKLAHTVRADGPGPGAYESKSTLSVRGAKSAGKLPQFFRPEDAQPGPGQYNPSPPVHCSLSHEVSARMVGFGTSTRTNYADKFCQRTPPPGAYDPETYGEIGVSRNGKCSIRGRIPAPSSFTSYITPGPGTYDSDGTCFGY